jgi:hypothetical protein
MKVKDEYEYMDVYGIYWINNETYFLCLSKKNGFGAERATDVTIVDPCLSGEFIFFDNNSVFYKPIIEEKLLDDLQEHDAKAFERFLEIIKKDGNKYNSYLELTTIKKWWSI